MCKREAIDSEHQLKHEREDACLAGDTQKKAYLIRHSQCSMQYKGVSANLP